MKIEESKMIFSKNSKSNGQKSNHGRSFVGEHHKQISHQFISTSGWVKTWSKWRIINDSGVGFIQIKPPVLVRELRAAVRGAEAALPILPPKKGKHIS